MSNWEEKYNNNSEYIVYWVKEISLQPLSALEHPICVNNLKLVAVSHAELVAITGIRELGAEDFLNSTEKEGRLVERTRWSGSGAATIAAREAETILELRNQGRGVGVRTVG